MPVAYKRFADIAEAMGIDTHGMTDVQAAEAALAAVDPAAARRGHPGEVHRRHARTRYSKNRLGQGPTKFYENAKTITGDDADVDRITNHVLGDACTPGQRQGVHVRDGAPRGRPLHERRPGRPARLSRTGSGPAPTGAPPARPAPPAHRSRWTAVTRRAAPLERPRLRRRRRRRRRAVRRARLHRRRPARHHRLPADPAGQAAAARGPGRRRQDRAGQDARRRPPAAGCCGCSATRARTRPRRSTSGTTASSCSTPRSCARRSARSSRTPPTSTEAVERIAEQDSVFFSERFLAPRPLLEAIRSERAGRAADRRGRPRRRGARGGAARAARGVPDLDPRGRHVRAPSTPPYVVLTSNNTRDLSAALKRRCLHLFLDYPDRRARAGDRPLQGHRPRRGAGRAAGRDRARAARAGAAQGAEHLRDHRLGPHARRARRRGARPPTCCRHRSTSS